MANTLLIIDDEESIRESLSGILGDEGFATLTASSAEEGLELLDQKDVDLILLDIWMPGMDGLEALKAIKNRFDMPIIMISGHGTIETAVQATRMGAFDFIEKPLSYDKTILSINKGLHVARLEKENRILRDRTPPHPDLTGNSPAIRLLREQIERVAPTDASVLIRGGHGTGKELVAQTIHYKSARKDRPMVEVNCAALPEELIESELFGHEKGAFTGATERRQGKFDLADGGTIFLDEIGDMSLKSQAKVLRILQEQKFERVGGSRTIQVDVRILAATNKNLEEAIEKDLFRADLFYRLNVVPILVPDLKDRIEDIPLLVQDFLQQFSRKGLGSKKISPDAIHTLMQHSWPGNVRELRNLVERLIIMIPNDTITREDITLFLGANGNMSFPAPEGGRYVHLEYREAKRQFEYDYLRSKLLQYHGNISQTAERIGMERSHLHKKVKALNIELYKE
ncbi:MAG: sigma-54 dependent transcriptional regulator [Desulfobulbaceae bacterium]|jgi:two-component system nitrogen regulation response regulator NtrX|nr:sigma-54 dependent transcriptional regulator [Desulfobulbaceae bacterium]MDY0351456.1 sigma-54 dependent transcriptional regulator [Desulfobulbaceae bacterium]